MRTLGRAVGIGAIAAACLTATAACGSSAPKDEAGSGGAGDSSPVTIALVVPLSGEAAVPRIYVDPAEMAVDELNENGGIAGRKVVLDKIDSGFTPQTAITAVNKAIGDDADVIVGLPITSQNVAVRTIVDRAKIPVLQLSVGDEADYLGEGKNAGASQYSFRVGTTNSMQVRASVDFAVDELDAKKIGLLSDADSAASAKDAFDDAVHDAGAEVGDVRTFAINSSDLTNEVLAMKGDDAVINRSYPNSMALAIKQMVQNNVLVPTVGSQSAGTVFENKLVEAGMLEYLYGSATCNPAGDAHAHDWLTRFEGRFDWTPDLNSAEVQDAISIFADVVEKVGDNPEKQLDALNSVDYTGGVCAKRYKADASHNMAHSVAIIGYTSAGPKTEKTYDFTAGQ